MTDSPPSYPDDLNSELRRIAKEKYRESRRAELQLFTDRQEELHRLGMQLGAQTTKVANKYTVRVLWKSPVLANKRFIDLIITDPADPKPFTFEKQRCTYEELEERLIQLLTPPPKESSTIPLHAQDRLWMRGFSRKNFLRRVGQGKCYLCGQPLRTRDVTVDHVIPTSKGGSDTLQNVKAACWKCNNQKGDKILDPTGDKGA